MTWQDTFFGTVLNSIKDRRVRNRLRKALELHRLSSKLLSTLDIDDVLQATIEGYVNVAQADAAAVFLIENNLVVRSLDFGFKNKLTVKSSKLNPFFKQIVESKKPLNLKDINTVDDTDDFFMEWVKSEKYRGLVALPILTDGVINALVMLFRSAKWSVGRYELEILKTLADQVGVAVKSALIHSQMSVYLQLLQQLMHLANPIKGTNELREQAQTITAFVINVLKFDRAYLCLLDRKTDILNGIAVSGAESGDFKPINLSPDADENDPLIQTMNQRQMVFYDNIDRRYPNIARFRLKNETISQAVYIPVQSHDHILGILAAEFIEPVMSDETDQRIRILGEFIDQVAILLDNALLINDQLERSLQLMTINEIAKKVNETLDLPTLMDTVVEQIAQSFHFGIVEIYFVDHESKSIHLQATSEPDRKSQVEKFMLKDYKGAVGYAIRTGETLVINDVGKFPGFFQMPGRSTRSELCIPLKFVNKTFGVLNIESSRFHRFSPQDVALLEMLCEQLAVGLRNVQLFSEVKSKNEFLNSIMESSEDGIITTSRTAKITFFSHSAEKMTGYNRSEVIHHHVDFLFPEGRQTVQKIIQNIRHNIKTQHLQLKLKTKSDKLIDVSMTISLLKNAEGVVIGIVSMFRDITRNLRLEELRKDLVAFTHHDLKQPLASVYGWNEFLLGELVGPINNEQRRLLMGIAAQTRRITQMSNDLKDSVYLDDNSLMVKPDFQLLPFIFDQVMDLVGFRAQLANVQLHVDFPDDLPPVYWDQEKVVRVLINLLENAINVLENEHDAHIRLSAKQLDDQWIYMEVKDSGPGIVAEELPYIFDRFHRVSKTKKKIKGTGLGLYIVKSFVELHFGTIEVESQLGVGTTFKISLPINPFQNSDKPPAN